MRLARGRRTVAEIDRPTGGQQMYVIAIHSISDPESFWGGELDLPDGVALLSALPNGDGSRGVCVWEADSASTVEQIVEGAAGEISDNEYFEVNADNAQGLPVATAQGA
jgi:hypothetical protein